VSSEIFICISRLVWVGEDGMTSVVAGRHCVAGELKDTGQWLLTAHMRMHAYAYTLAWASTVDLSKQIVIVWRLRGNIIRTVLYISNLLPLQWAQLTKTVNTARLGLESFYVFQVAW